jgi:hypothetical protein
MSEPDISVWMRHLAALSGAKSDLPDPAIIWWKAQLQERANARARAARPIAFAQWISLVVGLAAAVVLCAVNWKGMQGLLEPAGAALGIAAIGCLLLGACAMRFVFGE